MTAESDRPPRCTLIGVLDDGPASLSATAMAALASADVVIGGQRVLGLLAPHCPAEAHIRPLDGALASVPAWIQAAQAARQQVVVLATGDPLCHGIASWLQARLCIDAFTILPNVSTLQWACARLGMPWQDMRILSVHSRDAGEWDAGAGPEHGLYALRQQLAQHDRIALLTSPANSPDRIARLLCSAGIDGEFRMAVAERLLQSDERIVTDIPVADLARQTFADPNVVLLWRDLPRPNPVRFGLADTTFAQRQPEKGLITKREVRAVSLARLQLRRDSVVWDIGAGSGAVGLEAARLAPQGHVWAIEKNAADCAIARHNARCMQVPNWTLQEGRAPEGLDAWPDPDAIFIGGSGGGLGALIALCLRRLRPEGVLVMNFVTLENLNQAITTLGAAGVHWDVTQIQSARSRPILDMHRMAAENPVWIITAGPAEPTHCPPIPSDASPPPV